MHLRRYFFPRMGQLLRDRERIAKGLQAASAGIPQMCLGRSAKHTHACWPCAACPASDQAQCLLSCPAAWLRCHASNMLPGLPHLHTGYTFCTLRPLPSAVSPGTPPLRITSSLRAPWLQSMAAPSHGGAEPDSRSLQVCYMRASDALQELYANLREDQLMLLQVATAIWRKVRAHLLVAWADCCPACWLIALQLQLHAHRRADWCGAGCACLAVHLDLAAL